MQALPPPPPAIVSPQPIPTRNVLVWGDQQAMDALRANFEKVGWNWATMILGEKTNALMLRPPESVSDEAVRSLIDEINAGKFGPLNAGFGMIGSPSAVSKERRR